MSRRLIKYQPPGALNPHMALLTDDARLFEIQDFFNPEPLGLITQSLESIPLLPPLPVTPPKIIAVGLNYPAHITEMKHQEIPDDPVLFLKAPSTLIGNGETILARETWGRVDYEGELAVVIARQCKDVPEAEAISYALGYTLANDVTARELQRKDTQWGRAKNFDTFCPIGPALLVNDGQNPDEFCLKTEINGETVQNAYIRQMRFSVSYLISYISHMRIRKKVVIF